jgi:hypothetical protein
VRLVWVLGERTQGCADRATIARRVVARLGREVFSDSAPRSVEGVVQHEGDRWDAHLYVREADGSLFGSRYLSSTATPDCSALDAAVTLAIALAIDPEAAARPVPVSTAATTAPIAMPEAPTTPAGPTPSPSVLAPPAPPAQSAATASTRTALATAETRPSAPAPHPSPATSRSGSLAATGRALVAVGLLPGAAPGAALSVEGPVDRRLQATAGVVYLPETRTSGRDFGFGLTAGWLGACAQPWADDRVAIAFCGTILVGGIHSVVYTLEPTNPGEIFWASASASFTARFRIAGPFVVELGGEGLVPFTAYRFDVRGQTSPFQEGSVAGFGFVGMGVSIP